MTDTEEQKEVSYLRQKLAEQEIEIERLKGEIQWFKSKFILRKASEAKSPDSATCGGI